MLLSAVALLPFAAGLTAYLIPRDLVRRFLLVATALLHLGLCLGAAASQPEPAWAGLLDLDALGAVFLCLESLIFCLVSFYAVGYLRGEPHGERRDFQESVFFLNTPERVFTTCLLFFLGCMSLVAATRNLGFLWAAVEATTLATAPLIYFHRHHRSLEAAWKYLMICSVGIALALLGNIFLSAAQPGGAASLSLPALLSAGQTLDKTWVRLGFLFLLTGYGTKMGLAPMHAWLPDAHSESPSLVSALLSGALLNCAFLGILRAYQVAGAAGLADFCQPSLIVLGLTSMVFAAVFILGQGDFKRILAYSSVEHMGILALGLGLGSPALPGVMLHTVGHSLTKAMLFLLAGNILNAYHTKSSHDVQGVAKVLPVTGVLWMLGFLAICGSPPFSLFMSELYILKAALDTGRYLIASGFLALLLVIFVGMSTPVLRMAQGQPPPYARGKAHLDNPFSVGPALVLACLILLLGVYVPPRLWDLLRQAAQTLGGA
jgi:hydrogenase-4 component F